MPNAEALMLQVGLRLNIRHGVGLTLRTSVCCCYNQLPLFGQIAL